MLDERLLADERARAATELDRAASTLVLDEASTRRLIDQQLRDAGWEADSQTITMVAALGR